MTVQEYTSSALKFADASKDWESIAEDQFYTTFDGSWEVTGDNQNGGVGIEWAFHLAEDEIKKLAPQKFLDHIHSELTLALSLGGEDLKYTALSLTGLLKPGVYSNSEIK